MTTHHIISKPGPEEYPEWAAYEIDLAPYDDLLYGLQYAFDQALPLLENLSPADLSYRYAPGKWSIKQMWQHVMDVERVFTYRAMRYARQDETVLSGFDQNRYAELSRADEREWPDMLREYVSIRTSGIELFKSFTPEMFLHRGTAGRSTMTVRSVGYLMIGHPEHHLNIIRDRYLSR
jgi:hypothetical protein